MNKTYLFIIFFQFGLLFSQNTKIDKKQIIPREIDFNGNVKKITLKVFDLNKKEDKIDTTKAISEIYFSKLKKILKINKFDKSLDNLWNTTEFDDLERIKKISRKNKGKMFNSVIQYFSTENEFPDSTTIDFNENYKEKYINYFKNNLVIKQEHFVNDLLQDYRLYKYDQKNKLIEDLYLNPENDSDKTVVFKADNQLSFYPERLTKYEYKEIKDTLISIKIRPKYNLKEETKKLKTKKYTLEIKEDYDNDFLKSSRFTYTYKDSIKDLSYYYKNKKEIRDYYKTTITEKNIISKWKTEGYANNEERIEIIKIDIISDKHKNWIRKTYSKANQTTRIIEREIEYY
ncbi:hypothetical protein [Flavobacterium reichenbachii]|uniref:Uncharacterized protein n=1 Tax=Flavobacterium reichenbachii TaxID=362418 RepID=A0A085ZQG0_9FLAO|nr:hypothetical protein [Flavobacterium reichenbachii]KFF06674.1 hypothetical protein IW19_14665 [Flavobacterium reichenbachii]OXB18723.1 hypothetical protein B0A68_01535 [Flavobacterium reichenbachii]